MGVGLDQAGYHSVPLEVHFFGLRPGILQYFPVGAERQDMLALDRNRLGDSKCAVDRNYFAVEIDCIRGFFRAGAAGEQKQKSKELHG